MEGDHLTVSAVERALGGLTRHISVQVVDQCTSTNLFLRERAAQLPAWHTLIANEQSGGRGRMGRSFFSPGGTGLYMSVLLRPDLSPEDAALITPAAAVAMCRALEDLGAARPQIKWVNDVFIGGRKVCGILTESGFDPAGRLAWTVLGAGVNVTRPAGGFPPEIASTAGAAFPADRCGLRSALAGAFLRRFYELFAALPGGELAEAYRARSCLLGRRVRVCRGDEVRPALVLDTDERCRLLVRYDGGAEEALFSGEVTIRPEEA